MEREAKYRVTQPLKASRIEALDLAPYALGARAAHDLRDTVLDTAGQALGRSRHTLRIRRDGAETLLTLKAPGKVEGAIHTRQEIELPIASELRDTPERWPEPIAAPLRELIGAEPLAPLFRVRNRRRAWDVLRDGRRVAEIAFDRGRIEAGGRRESFTELEIEIKDDGTDEDLTAIVDLLRAALPLEPEPASKSARGMALLRSEDEQLDQLLKDAAGRAPMEPGAALAEAGRSIVARHLRKLRDSLPVIREGADPEGAHQLRVATRRMRAVLGALGGVAYEPRLV
ncbi:MAG TPA: CYTH domain-containing protein, partial [Herpetosiphonaceae bacterium]